uniref:LAGLIDADG homing endonuclease n=1 Tax=Fomitiporia mediterranea TaxID=208960 RepID=A0A5B9R9E3_9AGAM|nr:LAGLIDADG homing endonuclease [Fomitiporia mediterranea]QEG57068.1 LAGLIDADG homing endonuclease [Fomitiporia mediterranea]
MTGKGPTVIVRKPDKRTGKIYCQMKLKTLAFPCFNLYHDLFYKNGIKIIPKIIGDLLTARSLAYWIKDDGGKPSSNQTVLYTRSYTLEEVILLQKVLTDNFKLRTLIYEKNYWSVDYNYTC